MCYMLYICLFGFSWFSGTLYVSETIRDITAYLKKHPSETVIFCVNAENKKDNVKAPWQEEMAQGDFVSFAPSYRAGKYFSLV